MFFANFIYSTQYLQYYKCIYDLVFCAFVIIHFVNPLVILHLFSLVYLTCHGFISLVLSLIHYNIRYLAKELSHSTLFLRIRLLSYKLLRFHCDGIQRDIVMFLLNPSLFKMSDMCILYHNVFT